MHEKASVIIEKIKAKSKIGGQRKISRRSWLLNENGIGNKGFESKFLDDNIVLFHCGHLPANYA